VRVTAARAGVAVKADALAGARAADEAAARFAVADGDTPPAASTAMAADALDRAERATVAATQLAVEAQQRYLVAVHVNIDALTDSIVARHDAVRAEASQALDVLTSAIRESVALTDLARELDLDAIRPRRPIFRPRVQRRRVDPAEAPLAPIRVALGET
jgi:hypothetical protein